VLVTVRTAAYGARKAWVPAHGPVTSSAPTAASAALADCATTSRSRPGLRSTRNRSRSEFHSEQHREYHRGFHSIDTSRLCPRSGRDMRRSEQRYSPS
jgi:hypothetical protein